jgi:hypothetical protein
MTTWCRNSSTAEYAALADERSQHIRVPHSTGHVCCPRGGLKEEGGFNCFDFEVGSAVPVDVTERTMDAVCSRTMTIADRQLADLRGKDGNDHHRAVDGQPEQRSSQLSHM